MHTKLSRYLWFIVSTAVVVTTIAIAQLRTTPNVNKDCLRLKASGADIACLTTKQKDKDLINLSWGLLAVVAIIDIAIVLEPRPKVKSSKRQKSKTARR